jgi:hypothetical protein
MTVISAVSIFCDVATILTVVFPHLRSRAYIKVIMYITISNLLTSLGSVFGYAADGSAACYWEGYITNAMPIASIFWTIYVTVMVYYIVTVGKLIEIYWITHAVCWGLPILLASLPFINATYAAPDGTGWCFVVPYSSDPAMVQFWYWFSFYGWIWLGILINVILYVHVAFSITKIRSASTRSLTTRVFKKLIMYPFIVIFCWFVVCITDTVEAFSITFRYMNPVSMLGNALATVQGILTSVYFFYVNEEVLSAWHSLLLQGNSLEEIANNGSPTNTRRGSMASSNIKTSIQSQVLPTEDDICEIMESQRVALAHGVKPNTNTNSASDAVIAAELGSISRPEQ